MATTGLINVRLVILTAQDASDEGYELRNDILDLKETSTGEVFLLYAGGRSDLEREYRGGELGEAADLFVLTCSPLFLLCTRSVS